MLSPTVVRAGIALQAILFAAACSYDRSGPHPLRSRRTQVSHLLRRAGFGADRETLDEYESLGLVKAVDRLLDTSDPEDELDKRVRGFGLDLNKLGDLQRWWLMRIAYTRYPLREKMILFWHGFLTSGSAKVGLPNPTPQNPRPPHYLLDQHTFFRTHALDPYPAILAGIARDPAMMIWLDAQVNSRNKPNENFARELLELFTLGISAPDGSPNYSETDVREIARALTGRSLVNGVFSFRLDNHDTGVKSFLGKRGVFRDQDVIKILGEHPRTAEFLAERLFRFFAHSSPTPSELAPLVTAYRTTGGSVKEMLRALFTSPDFYSPRSYRALVKTPVEYVVGAIRALDVLSGGANLPGYTTRMGQALFNPPNVAGWPGGAAWLNTTTWLERINFANHVTTARNDSNTTPPQLALVLERHSLRTAEQVLDFFADFLLDGQLSPHARRTLLAYLSGGQGEFSAVPTGRKNASFRPGFIDQRVRGLVYLLLASPEYHLS